MLALNHPTSPIMQLKHPHTVVIENDLEVFFPNRFQSLPQ